MDSGATSHICSDEENFQNAKDCEKYHEQLEKERSVKTTTIGELVYMVLFCVACTKSTFQSQDPNY